MRKRSLWWLSQTTVMTVERTVAACRTGSSRGSSDKRCPKPNLHRHSLTTTPLCVCACVPYMLYDGGGVLAWHHSVCEWCCLECEAAFLKVEESVLWFSNLNIWLFSAVCLFFCAFLNFCQEQPIDQFFDWQSCSNSDYWLNVCEVSLK